MQSRIDEFEAVGAYVLAITGEQPGHFEQTGANLDIGFRLAYDEGLEVMQQYGLVYELSEALDGVYSEFGLDIAAANGTQTAMLPIPATYIIDFDGTVAAAWLNLDHTTRPEVDEVLDALVAL